MYSSDCICANLAVVRARSPSPPLIVPCSQYLLRLTSNPKTASARCYNSLFRRCTGSPSNFKAYNNVLSCEGLERSPIFKAPSQFKKSYFSGEH